MMKTRDGDGLPQQTFKNDNHDVSLIRTREHPSYLKKTKTNCNRRVATNNPNKNNINGSISHLKVGGGRPLLSSSSTLSTTISRANNSKNSNCNNKQRSYNHDKMKKSKNPVVDSINCRRYCEDEHDGGNGNYPSCSNYSLPEVQGEKMESTLSVLQRLLGDPKGGENAKKFRNDDERENEEDVGVAILRRNSSSSSPPVFNSGFNESRRSNYDRRRRERGATCFSQINSPRHRLTLLQLFESKSSSTTALLRLWSSTYLIITLLVFSSFVHSSVANVLPQFVLKDGQSEIVLRLKEGPATPVGSLVYKLKGRDDDGDELTFSLRGQQANELLRIENLGSDEANLYLRKELDREVRNSNEETMQHNCSNK